jgi:hypothetical protein
MAVPAKEIYSTLGQKFLGLVETKNKGFTAESAAGHGRTQSYSQQEIKRQRSKIKGQKGNENRSLETNFLFLLFAL